MFFLHKLMSIYQNFFFIFYLYYISIYINLIHLADIVNTKQFLRTNLNNYFIQRKFNLLFVQANSHKLKLIKFIFTLNIYKSNWNMQIIEKKVFFVILIFFFFFFKQ